MNSPARYDLNDVLARRCFLGRGAAMLSPRLYPRSGTSVASSVTSFELNWRWYDVRSRWFAPSPNGCSSSDAASLSAK